MLTVKPIYVASDDFADGDTVQYNAASGLFVAQKRPVQSVLIRNGWRAGSGDATPTANHLVAGALDQAMPNINAATIADGVTVFRIDPADFGTPMWCRFKVRAHCSATGPNQSLALQFVPYTVVAGIVTPGAPLASVSYTAAELNVTNQAVLKTSSDFQITTAGEYCFIYQHGGAVAVTYTGNVTLEHRGKVS